MLNQIKLVNTNWDYAKLTSFAKANGGPEKMINTIYTTGRLAGRKDMCSIILGLSALNIISLGANIYLCAQNIKLKKKFK